MHIAKYYCRNKKQNIICHIYLVLLVLLTYSASIIGVTLTWLCVTGRPRSLWKLCHSKALVCFCRAMRCISAAYVVMWCLSECLSVCLSVCLCVRPSNKRIFNFFSPSGSQTIQVVSVPNVNYVTAVFRRDPLTGRRMQGVWTITIFDKYLDLSRKMMQDRAIVTMKGE